jgi:predicted porin
VNQSVRAPGGRDVARAHHTEVSDYALGALRHFPKITGNPKMTPTTTQSLRSASPTDARARQARRRAGATRLGGACLLLASVAAAPLALAQSANPPIVATSGSTGSDSLTWNGITLYGIVDIGLQYQTHGAPSSDYFPAGTEAIIQKNSNNSVTALTPNNMSQSRIGLSGNEPIPGGDWAGVFKVETYFNPTSGELSDALKSITINNGRPANQQSTNVDSSIAGQLFGVAYAGLASPTWGSFTFGRQLTTLADGITKYDPMSASQAFSLIGFSGTAAGDGDTEDRRLDQAFKYVGKYDWLHAGALYQFGGSRGSTNTAYQFNLGADAAGFSVDAYYAKKYNAVAASALSGAQVDALPTTSCGPPAATPGPTCLVVNNTVAATVSDNQTYGVMASYSLSTWKFYAGYENITFENPSNPYYTGQEIIGGYKILVANPLNPYPKHKVYDYGWVGVKWTPVPQLDIAAAWYAYHQNAYAATGANVGCSSNLSGTCSGTYQAASVMLDYRLTKRFDAYIGSMWSSVDGGLSNGYDLNTSTITTTTGIRFKF